MPSNKQLIAASLLLALGSLAQAQNAAVDRLRLFARNKPQFEVARAVGTLCFPGNRLSARLQDDCNNLVGNAFGANPSGDTSVRAALAAITGDNVTIPIDRSGLGRSAAAPAAARGGANFASLLAPAAEMASLTLGEGGGQMPWSLYIGTRFDRNERDPSEDEDGFDADGATLTVGFDLYANERINVGAALLYGRQDMDYTGNSGKLESTDVALNLYAGWQAGGWHAESLLALTRRDYDQLRRIVYGIGSASVNQAFDSRFDGEENLFALGAGYQWSVGASHFDPYLRIEWVDAASDGYTEVSRAPLEPGGGWAMEVDALDENFTRGIAGLRWSHAISTGNGVWMPYADLSWIQVSGLDAEAATVRYAGDRSNTVALSRLDFFVDADEEDDSYGSAALGISAQWANGWAGYAGWRRNFSEERYQRSELNLGLRHEF